MKCKYCDVPCRGERKLCYIHEAHLAVVKKNPAIVDQMLRDLGWVAAHNYVLAVGEHIVATGIPDAKALGEYLADFSEEQMANAVIIRYDKIIKGLKRKIIL